MDHKPVPHYRVLQLWLLGTLYLITAKASTGSNSCLNGVYLPGVDSFIITETVIVDIHDIADPARVYIGSEDFPTDYLLCQVNMFICPPLEYTAGCYCQYVSMETLDSEEELLTYVITIYMPLSQEMANKSVFIFYKSMSRPDDEHKTVPPISRRIPPMIGVEPLLTLIDDGKLHHIKDHKCPTFRTKQKARIKFCASNLQNPLIRMYFDAEHIFTFVGTCGEMEMVFTKRHHGKQFWLSYSDSCKRHGILYCRYPKSVGSTRRVAESLLCFLLWALY